MGNTGSVLSRLIAMPISFDCPHCGTHMEILDRYAGETGPCAVCAREITIPMLAGQADSAFRRKPSNPESPASGLSLGMVLAILGGSIVGLCVVFIAAVVIARVALPAASSFQTNYQSTRVRQDLKRIVEALALYHDEHGSYPPAYLVDDAGVPLHSWRVMILPQLGRHDLYDQYDFSEPWDSPVNLHLVQQMPSVFQAPSSRSLPMGYTNYVVFTGKSTLFPPSGSVTSSDVLDDHATVLAVAESYGPGWQWTDPNSNLDLSGGLTLMVVRETSQPQSEPAGTLSGNVAMLNGVARWLPDTSSSVFIESLATRSGGEDVSYELQLAD